MDLDNSPNKQWKTDENVPMYLDIIKLALNESRTLSDSAKEEVSQWLLTINSDGSKGDSSCIIEREYVSTPSRKSGIRSGNSSLESNFETPVKRRKLTEPSPSTVRQKKRCHLLKNQPRIDQYFEKLQKEQLQVTRDILSSSENLPKTPVKNTENMILSRKNSDNDKTPDRKSIPVNSAPRKNTVTAKRRFVAKTPADLKNLGKSINNATKENHTNPGTPNSKPALSENSNNIGVLGIVSRRSHDKENVIENPSTKDRINVNSEINDSPKDNLSESNINVVKASCIFQNMFISNSKSEEASPDCSSRTAPINNEPLQENISKTSPIVRKEEKNHQKKVQGVCDSESDSDDSNGSFDLSDSDIEIISPPLNTIVKIPVKSALIEQRTSPHINIQPVKKSFLASLSNDVPLEDADAKAVNYQTNYSTLKEELCKELYALYNEKVFVNKLPIDMPIEWNVRMLRTAGKYKCSKSLEKAASTSRILLSTKILNSPDRLRDVLIHEMCHAATTLINNVRDGHGSLWKAWASKAVEVFPELPTITRCHSYETEKKFTYMCTCCGHSFGRHRTALDINKKLCGYCSGPFEILINKNTKAGKVQEVHVPQKKEPKGFAVYVKENFHVVRQKDTSIKHAEVIKILKQQFSAIEVTSKQGN